ncbi:palmitoyltransferase ZDHHC20 isoform X1 [Esox lucius]|uniref:palmitoyltransferase ZDHHC20 isoform X1 n=2 Tax=Esox lucius TaxID=8010 RepID=UPI0009733657|nr:palmitoyltransferase ZDHHC20 isoform X1 [Esox lucius]
MQILPSVVMTRTNTAFVNWKSKVDLFGTLDTTNINLIIITCHFIITCSVDCPNLPRKVPLDRTGIRFCQNPVWWESKKMAPTHILRCCQRGLAWIPVIFIALVVCWSYYAYVVELCIYTIPSIGEKIIYMMSFHLSFVMFVWSYWKTIFTRPAKPSKEFCLAKAEKEQYVREERPETQQEILWRAATNLPLYTRTGAGAIRYCDRCQVIKPDRCHHCSACDMCVLKMDHHCPWVNNCVGFSNYKFFILFLCYSLIYCLFIAATVLQYFIKFWTLCRRKSAEHCPKNELPDTHAKFHVLFLFFVAAMFCISILSLFSYHLWLVGKNRSTIEAFRAPVFRTGSDKNGFSLGFRKNIAQVFGDQKKLWLLPIFTSQGDGQTFPARLVSVDPEQPTVSLQPEANKITGDGQTCPLTESQNHLQVNEQQDNHVAKPQECDPMRSAETVTISMETESLRGEETSHLI